MKYNREYAHYLRTLPFRFRYVEDGEYMILHDGVEIGFIRIYDEEGEYLKSPVMVEYVILNDAKRRTIWKQFAKPDPTVFQIGDV